MKELIETMAKALVDFPEQVHVSEKQTGSTVVIRLEVAKADIGKVIGKKGKTARALAAILAAASGKGNVRAALEIVDE
jgi:predicted RNA-binding protein YlqC (UPF0109 family)